MKEQGKGIKSEKMMIGHELWGIELHIRTVEFEIQTEVASTIWDHINRSHCSRSSFDSLPCYSMCFLVCQTTVLYDVSWEMVSPALHHYSPSLEIVWCSPQPQSAATSYYNQKWRDVQEQPSESCIDVKLSGAAATIAKKRKRPSNRSFPPTLSLPLHELHRPMPPLFRP